VSVAGAGRFATVGRTSSRALVIGLVDAGLDGAALVEAAIELVRIGADLVEVPDPAAAARLRAAADLPVVGPGATHASVADDVAALAVAVVGGARAVRTHDVRAARRVVDVIAAIEAQP
jgi:hypothetical protein